MDEYRDSSEVTQQANRDRWAEIRSQVNRPLVVGIIALLVILGITAAYGIHQQALVKQLSAQSAASTQAMNQLQGQVNRLTTQLAGMNQGAQTSQSAAVPAIPEETGAETSTPSPTPTAAAVDVAPVTPAMPHAPAKHRAVKRQTAAEKHYAELQAQLAEQEKELKETQQQLERNRTDLEGNINSTRDELSGSIAKTHDELVVLEKRGERNYFEFELSKSKQFQRVGPLSISLRKADTKHKSYDLSMIVDDNELSKKKVNLYEPVTIHTDSGAQPVQIVVNRISKDVVHGYVSAAKYTQPELTPATASSGTPASVAVPPGRDVSATHQP
jgi:cell division protein FtsB